MDLIEQLKAQAFAEYLQKYGNTICGRHPIGVLLNVSLSFYFYKSLLSAIFGPRGTLSLITIHEQIVPRVLPTVLASLGGKVLITPII